ncbi:MAG TPA: hypothetical protein VMF89_36505 [Polyangiales bacterium]|nr:hypothetical protein [Polyangiales bacterium]
MSEQLAMPPGDSSKSEAPSSEELSAFLGRFVRSEPERTVRARIDAAIEEAIAPMSWPLRLVVRPSLRFVAEMPEWVTIERSDALIAVTFSNGVTLRAEPGGAPRMHNLPAGFRANVRHFWQAGRLCTEMVSDHGSVSNVFERVAEGELLGHATLASQHFPLPVRYSIALRRAGA